MQLGNAVYDFHRTGSNSKAQLPCLTAPRKPYYYFLLPSNHYLELIDIHTHCVRILDIAESSDPKERYL